MQSLFKLKKQPNQIKPKTFKENLQNDSMKNILDSLPKQLKLLEIIF